MITRARKHSIYENVLEHASVPGENRLTWERLNNNVFIDQN